MTSYSLFIDESGIANPKVYIHGCYILCGCLVNDYVREQLQIKADQIKYKFWEKTNIVFHSRDIWRKEGSFSILRDDQIKHSFERLLFDFLSKAGYQVFIVIVDNKKASKKNWNDKKVYKETSNTIVRNFVLALLATKARGRLVIESASSEKDFYFHKAASHYLAKGIPELDITYQEIQKALTEISFVTKKNFDIEEQIADLLAYGAKLRFLKKPVINLTNYDKQIIKTLKAKLFVVHPNTGKKKRKYYSKIESFKILP